MTHFLHIPYKVHCSYEYLRSVAIDQGKISDWLMTYINQKIYFPDKNTKDFWDRKFTSKIEDEHLMAKHRNAYVADRVKNKSKWMNIGVGDGRVEEIVFSTRYAINYLGSDITEDTLNRIKSKYPQKTFLQLDLSEIEAKINEQYDVITLLEVYEHLHPLIGLALLRVIKKLLYDNGELIISVPVNEGLSQMLPNNPNQHMRILTERLLIQELRLAGFDVMLVKRLSAFRNWFVLKSIVNSILHSRLDNNIILIAKKKS